MVNICVAILILKMEENIRFWHVIPYYLKKGKSATEKQKMCTEYGEGAVTDRTYQTWFAKFRAGDLSRGDAPRSGRPVDQLKLIATKSRR